MRTARLAGHYLNVMATASVLAIVIHPLFGLPVQLDLLGIALGFWTGFGILNGRRGFRTGMLILTMLGMIVGGGFLIYLAWATGPVGGRELRTPELAAVQMTAVLLIMLPLPALLLMPATRRWFDESRNSPPPRYRLTSKVISLYILAGVLTNALPVALEKWPDTAEPSGKSGGFTYGNDETGMVSTQWLEDKASQRPL